MEIVEISKDSWNTDYIVHWKVSDVCNYDCSYCEPSNHKTIDIKNITTAKKLIEGIDRIKRAVGDKTVQIVLTGGEPFLIPNIEQFLAKIAEYKFRIVIFTNGSMPMKIYKRCLPYLKEPNDICISFHSETAEVDHIVKLAQVFKQNNERLEIRAMLAPGLTHKVKDLIEKLEPYSIGVNALVVYPLVEKSTGKINPTFNSSRNLVGWAQDSSAIDRYYSEEEHAYIKRLESERKTNKQQTRKGFPMFIQVIGSNGLREKIPSSAYSIIMKNKNVFKDWQCAITKKKIAIDSTGNISYGICNNHTVIGNIYQDDFEYKDTYITCVNERCTTVDEIMVDKFKSNTN